MIPVARDTTIVAYRYLCRRGARKFLRSGLERGDLEQVAAIGLIKAYDRYDTSLKTPFEAYAWITIVGELMHHVRDHERLVRAPRWLRSLERRCTFARESLNARSERETSEHVPLHQHETVGPEDRILVSRAVNALGGLQQKIVLGVYGLGMTQAELARKIGISTRHLSRLHRQALHAMRHGLTDPVAANAPNRKIPVRKIS